LQYPMSADVTLNVEVPYDDHFDMIAHTDAWCQDDSIARIMNDTGVLILFPCGRVDSDEPIERVNTIKLRGPVAKVEEARRRLRDLCPVTIAIPLLDLKADLTIDGVKELIGKAIADKRIDSSHLEITVMQKSVDKEDHGWVCVVRGSLRWEDEIHDACVALRYLLFDTDDKKEHDPTSFYASQLDIPISQQLSVLGVRDAFLVRLVSNQTGALVCYPSPGNVTPEGQPVSMLYLRGPVKSILHARRYIQGLLPVQLFFDIEGCDLLERVDRAQRNITKRDDIFGVNITITASRIEGEQISEDDFMRHMVMIESGEFNLNNVYAFRHTLYRPGVLKEPTVITDQYNFFDPLVKELVFANNKVLFEVSSVTFPYSKGLFETHQPYFFVHNQYLKQGIKVKWSVNEWCMLRR
uniref:Defective in germ line development protein 3 (inferred by orthology to a C. elegans protein) n=1 Tax=Anisakis simplex TaxID=6269 RepID=A0A0M3KF43_ANISI